MSKGNQTASSESMQRVLVRFCCCRHCNYTPRKTRREVPGGTSGTASVHGTPCMTASKRARRRHAKRCVFILTGATQYVYSTAYLRRTQYSSKTTTHPQQKQPGISETKQSTNAIICVVFWHQLKIRPLSQPFESCMASTHTTSNPTWPRQPRHTEKTISDQALSRV